MRLKTWLTLIYATASYVMVLYQTPVVFTTLNVKVQSPGRYVSLFSSQLSFQELRDIIALEETRKYADIVTTMENRIADMKAAALWLLTN